MSLQRGLLLLALILLFALSAVACREIFVYKDVNQSATGAATTTVPSAEGAVAGQGGAAVTVQGGLPSTLAAPGFQGATLGTMSAAAASSAPAADAAPKSVSEAGQGEVTIAAVGDVLIHQALINAAWREGEQYDFRPLFGATKDIVAAADLAFFDMEGTMKGKPYSGYPAFSAPESLAPQLAEIGFDVAVTANNHAIDFDIPGLKKTVENLRAGGLTVLGSRLTAAEPQSLIKEVKGMKLGFLAFTYESGRGGQDGQRRCLNGVPIAAEDEALIDSFSVETAAPDVIARDVARITERITALRQAGAEAIVALMHWGTEYGPSEDAGQIVYAQALADAGVNVVFACGPHITQHIRDITSRDGTHEMLCYYSMGNFVSNQQFDTGQSRGHAQDGLMALVSFARGADGKVSLARQGYINTFVLKRYPKGADEEHTEAVVLPLRQALAQPQLFGLSEAEVAEAQAALLRCEEKMQGNTPEKFDLREFSGFFQP